MSRKRLGKRERQARNSKRRRIIWMIRSSNGTTEEIRAKAGHKKAAKINRKWFKPISKQS